MILVYGAYGYTGRLICRQLESLNFNFVEAGRSPEKMPKGGRSFSLDDPAAVKDALTDISLVVNCAGPFQLTGVPLARAAVENHAHYLDLAGEVPEHLALSSLHQMAQEAGVVVMPGAGFGILPTDLLLAKAASQVPGVEEAELVYQTVGGASRGTLGTVLGDIHRPGVRREEGSLEEERVAEKRRYVDFGDGPILAISNPWRADLAHSRSPTLRTYTAFPGPVVFLMKNGHRLAGVLRSRLFHSFLQKLPDGPGAKQRERGATRVWAEVSGGGDRRACRLIGPEAYDFTAQAVAHAAGELLNGSFQPGYRAPSEVLGPEFLDRFETRSDCFPVPHERPWPAEFQPNDCPVYSWNLGLLEAPVSRVWDLLVDAPGWPRFYSNARNIKVNSESSKLGLGVSFTWRTFGVPVSCRVTEWEPGRCLAWQGEGLGSTGYHRWRLEPNGEGCVVVTDEVQKGPLVSLLAPILTRGLLYFHQRWIEGLGN